MNLKSKEEAFRFVMCEIWSEMNHIHGSLNPFLSIHFHMDRFILELTWHTKLRNGIHKSDPISLTELHDANLSMTSWLRTFIHESKIQEDCPVREAYAKDHEKYASEKYASEKDASPQA
jgi:hypothetical protein